MLLSKSGHSPLAVEKLNISGNVTVTVMQDSGLLKGEKNYMNIYFTPPQIEPFQISETAV
jgi:hypothetical protein